MKPFLPLCALVSLLMGSVYTAQAQYQDTISADRPGITISPYVVGKKVLQAEHGVEFFDNFEDTANINTYTTEHVIRYGLSERFELNALFEYEVDRITLKDDGQLERQNGISNLHLGFRVSLCDEKKWRPAIVYQLRLVIPHVSAEYGNEYVAPEMSLSTQYSLPKNMTFGTTWVLAWDGNTPAPLGQYALNFGFPIVGNLNGYVEHYGDLQSKQYEARVDGGLMYFLGPNLQLDLSAGYGRNHGITDYFVSTGIAWRVRFRERGV
ncbi:hypothetical protein BH09BAC1_BH09BAC1_18350 [soil metagenome]